MRNGERKSLTKNPQLMTSVHLVSTLSLIVVVSHPAFAQDAPLVHAPTGVVRGEAKGALKTSSSGCLTPRHENFGLDKNRCSVGRPWIHSSERTARNNCAGHRGGRLRRHPEFTYISEDDFRIVQVHLHDGSPNTRDRLLPFCLFTGPEIAPVGLNENEALAAGRPYRVAKLPSRPC